MGYQAPHNFWGRQNRSPAPDANNPRYATRRYNAQALAMPSL